MIEIGKNLAGTLIAFASFAFIALMLINDKRK